MKAVKNRKNETRENRKKRVKNGRFNKKTEKTKKKHNTATRRNIILPQETNTSIISQIPAGFPILLPILGCDLRLPRFGIVWTVSTRVWVPKQMGLASRSMTGEELL